MLTIRLDDEDYALDPGAFIAIPGGVQHSWTIPASGDDIVLVKRAGLPDFHFVNR